MKWKKLKNQQHFRSNTIHPKQYKVPRQGNRDKVRAKICKGGSTQEETLNRQWCEQ